MPCQAKAAPKESNHLTKECANLLLEKEWQATDSINSRHYLMPQLITV